MVLVKPGDGHYSWTAEGNLEEIRDGFHEWDPWCVFENSKYTTDLENLTLSITQCSEITVSSRVCTRKQATHLQAFEDLDSFKRSRSFVGRFMPSHASA